MKKWYLLLLFLIITGCKNNYIVARVGNYTISSKEFLQSFLDDKSLTQARSMSYEQKLAHLTEMIESRLILQHAYRQHLEQDSSILRALKSYEEELVFRKTIDKEIVEKVIPPQQILQEYQKKLKEARVFHIFIPFNKEDQKKADELLIFLNDIRKEIIASNRFEEYATKFSKDSLSAGKGGDLGFIKWGDRNYGDQFYNKVFKMREGDVSFPIRSDKGFHLVKLTKYRHPAVQEFQFEKEQIKKKLIGQKRNELKAEAQRFLEKLKRRYSLKINEENLQLLESKINGEISKNKTKFGRGVTLFKDFTTEDKKRDLINYDGGMYTIGRFIGEYNKLPPSGRPEITTAESLKNYIRKIFPNELIIRWGYENGINKSDDIKEQKSIRSESLMIKSIKRNRSALVDNITEEELRSYYRIHQKNYLVPEKYKVQEIMVGDIETAMMIIDKSKSQSFDSLAQKYNTRRTTRASNGMLGFIARAEYGPIGQVASRLEIGAISNPIKNGDNYSVIRILEKKEETIPAFGNLRFKLKADMKREKREKLQVAWLDSLRAATTIAVYESNLKRVFN